MIRYWLNQKRERLMMAVAWRTPRWLAYWCTVRLFANATTGEFGSREAPAVRIDEMLDAWHKRRGGEFDLDHPAARG